DETTDQTPEASAQGSQPSDSGSVNNSAEANEASQANSAPPPPLEPDAEGAHAEGQPVTDMGDSGKQSAQPESESTEPAGPVGRIEIAVVRGDFSVRGGGGEVVVDTHGEDTDDPVVQRDGVVRIGRLPDGAELWAPDGFEVIV